MRAKVEGGFVAACQRWTYKCPLGVGYLTLLGIIECVVTRPSSVVV